MSNLILTISLLYLTLFGNVWSVTIGKPMEGNVMGPEPNISVIQNDNTNGDQILNQQAPKAPDYRSRLKALSGNPKSADADYMNELCNFSGTYVYITTYLHDSAYLGVTNDKGRTKELEYYLLTNDEAESKPDFKWIIRCFAGKVVLENAGKTGFWIAWEYPDQPSKDEIYAGIASDVGALRWDKTQWTVDFHNWDNPRNSFIVSLTCPNGVMGYSQDSDKDGRPRYDPHVWPTRRCPDDDCWHYIRVASATETWNEVARITNQEGVDTTYTLSVTTGVTNTKSYSKTVESTVSAEVQAAYGGVSCTTAFSLTNSWTSASESTFEKSVSETIEITLKGGTYVVYQLCGTYNDNWKIQSNIWNVVKVK